MDYWGGASTYPCAKHDCGKRGGGGGGSGACSPGKFYFGPFIRPNLVESVTVLHKHNLPLKHL